MDFVTAESVRAELTEAPDCHDLPVETAEAIKALDDATIDTAIRNAVFGPAGRDGDWYWQIYDAVRRDAIVALAETTKKVSTR